MSRPKSRKYINVNCSFCNVDLGEKPLYREQKNYFCNSEHYHAWRRKQDLSSLHQTYSDKYLLKELQDVANSLKHLPTYSEFRQFSDLDHKLYWRHFGSWKIALTCIIDPTPPDLWSIDNISPQDGYWISGLTDGEGHFSFKKSKASYGAGFSIQLRADDIDVLTQIRDILGLQERKFHFWHRDKDRARGINAGDSIRFAIHDLETIITRIIPFFERFPLRSKKVKDFEIWVEAAELLWDHRQNHYRHQYTPELRRRLEILSLAIKDIRIYRRPDVPEDI